MIEVVAGNGWDKNLRLSNQSVELFITLEVGPRILSYTTPGGFNPLKNFEAQMGTCGDATWKIRGGHRLWVAPEHRTETYFPDNGPVAWEKTSEYGVRLTPAPEVSTGWKKEIEITLSPTGTGTKLMHRITRTGNQPATMAPWALTVMTTGGVAVVPQPALGEHPRDLLPNRSLILWSYTDLSDRRWKFGRHFLRLRQDPTLSPTKIGSAGLPTWCAYFVRDVCFIKQFSALPNAAYPDNGCNFEMFTGPNMLELESLGPLGRLAPGETVEHAESWTLHPAPGFSPEWSDEDLLVYFAGLEPKLPPR